MRLHTSFQIGGPARFFVRPRSDEEARAVAALCAARRVPLLPLGNGSNVLMADSGYGGVVLSLEHLDTVSREGNTLICGAGVPLKTACEFALAQGLAGMEFAYGIPGSVGGAVFMNAGAYGGEMKDIVSRSWFVSKDGPGSFEGDAHGFGYRRSVYSDGGRIVTRAAFSLHSGDPASIRARMNELMQRRRDKQPLEYPSAGSVFKRPPGHFAGTLIEGCGLKGARVGGAAVSKKHAGFIVNLGGATCADVQALIRQVQACVEEKAGVRLESEIQVVG